MKWESKKKEIIEICHGIDKSIKIYNKDNWFCKTLSWLLFIFTFGGIKRKVFLAKFATTIGPLHFYPANWDYRVVKRVCVHEARHTQQCRWFGLWIHPWVGLPLYGILYILLPLPMGLAFFRAYFEMDAARYECVHYVKNEHYPKPQAKAYIRRFAGTVGSSAYGWPLPKSWCRKLFNRALSAIDATEESDSTKQ